MKKIHPDVSPELNRLASIVNEAKDTVLKYYLIIFNYQKFLGFIFSFVCSIEIVLNFR